MPNRSPDWIRTQPIAHRGLHDEKSGVIENTLGAFEAAAAAGYAIELDVLPSADGEAIIFHDATLDRLTAAKGLLAARSAVELSALQIKGSTETIPTLADLLSLIRGRVPLLIELKALSPKTGILEARVAELIGNYSGAVAVQSFNPLSMGWFARNAPKLIRGQLSMNYGRDLSEALGPMRRWALTNLLFNSVSKPDFIAYEAKSLPASAPNLARKLGLPVIAWTLRSSDEWARIHPHADNLIFEGFKA